MKAAVRERFGSPADVVEVRDDKGQLHLVVLRDLLETGKLRSVIDRRYEPSEVADALGYIGDGRARGKIVVTVGEVAQ
jgi:Zinc-binding dehydrogenase